jgi:hypothetical protein
MVGTTTMMEAAVEHYHAMTWIKLQLLSLMPFETIGQLLPLGRSSYFVTVQKRPIEEPPIAGEVYSLPT